MSVNKEGRTSGQLKRLFLSALLKTIHHCTPRWWTITGNTLCSHESPRCKTARGFREVNGYFADSLLGRCYPKRQRRFWPKSQQPTHSWSGSLSSSVISVLEPGCVCHTFRLPPSPFPHFWPHHKYWTRDSWDQMNATLAVHQYSQSLSNKTF